MKRQQIAAQLYTVRDFIQTADELDRTLAKIKAIGYEAVQVSAIGAIDPVLVKQSADRHGLTICATHFGYNQFVEQLETIVRTNKLWNCKYVGLGALPPILRNEQGYREFAGTFTAVSEQLRQQGLQFVYHNHRFEFEKFNGSTGLDILLETAGTAEFGFELDTYWALAGGADPIEWIQKLAGRMKVIHLKDMAVVNDQPVFAEIGEGNMNWRKIIAACRDIGMEWYIVEQDICLRDPFDSLEMSFHYLAALAD